MSDQNENPAATDTTDTDEQVQEIRPAVVVRATSDEDPASFGRIDEDGNVWVREASGERQVGSYPDGVPDDPFGIYTRRYRDLEATVNLFESRLPTLNAHEIDTTLTSLKKAVEAPAAVGDLDGLRKRVADLQEAGAKRKEEAKAERAAAKQEALELRTAVVEQAEAVAAQDPERTQWKHSGQRLRDLLEEWKRLQRRGPRLDRPTEDALWKRFSSARSHFDRGRRQFFAKLDARQAEVKRVKEGLIAEAEAMQNSTDWGRTSAAYRDLMDRWKAAGRASRKVDDALWERFRAAQQVFFDARHAKDKVVDEDQRQNLQAKEELLVRAEALLPVKDLEATKSKLRDIQDEWEEIGFVPRADMKRVEGRLRKVEQAVRDAEDQQWKQTDPRTKARAGSMLGQLEDSIAELKADLEKAQANQDAAKEASIREALETKQAWFKQISDSVDE
ncbi:DUF349 domain-containing protein [Gleimia hominis]|uniref:DUF349 domain-containing protein n=1 Tax=Gleimia hominis TaxID=595468 RepID=A0ABU3IBD7_9ACTO|nr:DUF349 domain-containing protein [Gleimia hominis]MDT3767693.1 DUF349 domain-containing protein [Gleimia hominis]